MHTKTDIETKKLIKQAHIVELIAMQKKQYQSNFNHMLFICRHLNDIIIQFGIVYAIHKLCVHRINSNKYMIANDYYDADYSYYFSKK